MTSRPSQPRRSFFRKYFLALFAAVVVPLLANGGSEAWLGYRDQRAGLDERLGLEARAAAGRIEGFVAGIRDQLGWMVQLPWTDGPEDQRRIDALRLLRQVPAISDLTLVDGVSRERLYVSRVGLDRINAGTDRSDDPAVEGARAARVWYGPVRYHQGSEPFMRIAVAGNRAAVGVAVAEINLKLIWDVISAIRVGDTGQAFVLDGPGRLIAHLDIGIVLRGADDPTARTLQELRSAIIGAAGRAATGTDVEGRTVMAAMAPVPGVDWTVVVEQPLVEAFGPIYAALWRTAALLLAGTALSSALAYWLARRMTGPIRVLEEGTERIGAGQFDHRITITTGDELERLAAHFNNMAKELAVSQERSERIDRLKRFLAPQLAELVERTGESRMLEGQRTEIAVVFCDLRGFTAFSNKAEPEEIIAVLNEYYSILGAVVTRHEGTLTSFQGDGLMIILNAPIPYPDPALRAVRMATDAGEHPAAHPALASAWLCDRLRRGPGIRRCNSGSDRHW